MTPLLRVVTLPPTLLGSEAIRFAEEVRRRGANVLEVRTDLHAPEAVDGQALARVLPLLISERGKPLPSSWMEAATYVDRDVTVSVEVPSSKWRLVASHHAARPLSSDEALCLWEQTLPANAWVKHVEPLGPSSRVEELLETQSRLIARFGAGRVTVLGMGPAALPARVVLARRNALDYVAAGGSWSAAPGQRLLDDAVRELRAVERGTARGGASRLGILGTSIVHSRSPRIHRQPFDRIDIPEDGPVEELVDSLLPHYAGFAVTSPFKLRLARHTRAPLEAINTLVRRGNRWESFNTDVAGARAVLERLGAREVFVLGDGGSTAALRAIAPEAGVQLRVLKRSEVHEPLRGAGLWTWPDRIAPPEGLRFDGARVAVIAYGAPGRRVAQEIARRGGTPVMLGSAWFIAQARRQRELWESAT
ncbi:shikimate dehydrogenase [Hyalangium rubrum]|uniref:Shikimate dehydrogenase n=1 Tax=Hyalangium rubrum TaxID=3103134 RepID=A0ABU5HDS3_9BACT|nr:shikimate dehydrogenase [Hyalangium sp. s54d21]MDY7231620.1 shikimate dehydrogenase [Hyalangium sp. s54d21]